jgi:hypothetical protein
MKNMKSINFDAKYVRRILSGEKRTTIRKGIKIVEPNSEVVLTTDGGEFGKAIVRKAIVKRISELNEEEAKLDGFSSKDELLKDLRRIYGSVDEDDIVTVIYFDVLSE